MPIISIVIPVYKVEEFISSCIESILVQSYNDFELLLIDDGSPDKSGAICDEYAVKDKRIKVIHKENAGVGAARNTGILNAKGDWIIFVDSDDYIDQGMLQSGVAAIYNNPEVDAVLFYNRKDNVETGKQEIIDRVFCFSKIATSKELFIESNYFEKASCIYSKLYKRNLIEKYGIRFASTPVYEDVLFNMNYFTYAKSIFFIDKFFYHYMIYPSVPSLTRSIKKPYDILKTTKAFFSIEENLFENLFFSDKEKSLIRNRFFRIATWGVSNMYRMKLSEEERISLLNEFIPLYKKFEIKDDFSMLYRKMLLTNPFFSIRMKDWLLSKLI